MPIHTFEFITNNIKSKAMSYIAIEKTGGDITSTPFQTVMRDQMPKTIYEVDHKITVSLHPNEETN